MQITWTLCYSWMPPYCDYDEHVETGWTNTSVSPHPPPVLSQITPAAATIGATVSLTGSQFRSSGQVTFNGVQAAISYWSDTLITATVPTGATTGSVVVTAVGQSSGGAGFTVVPETWSVTPGSGPVGHTVTVSGTGFGGGGTLTFNGTAATSIPSWTATSITAHVPVGATSGPVVVTTGGYGSNSQGFTVTASPPQISLVTPASGVHGQAVVLTGEYFGGSPGGVTFHGSPAQVLAWSEQRVEVRVPLGIPLGPVSVLLSTVEPQHHGTTFTVVVEQVSYYHTDGLGSVRLITGPGPNPQVLATNDFLPFGDDWQPTGPLDSRGFAEMERAPGTGAGSWTALNYAGARYYSSQAGRFTTPDDPIYIDPDDPQSWNLYAYARNNPLIYVDPTGRFWQCVDGPCDGDDDDGFPGWWTPWRPVVVVVREVVPQPVREFFTMPRDPVCLAGYAAGGAAIGGTSGAVLGGIAGAAGGGGAGTVAGPAGTIAVGTAGAIVGSAQGAQAGVYVGSAVGTGAGLVACMAGSKGGGGAEHTKGARPSTKEKHQTGQSRKRKDRGGEKGDKLPPRKRPTGWKGPWPPAPGTPWW